MMKFNKTIRTMTAVAMAAIGAGCTTMNGPEKQPWEKYEGFLNPHDQDFQVQKEAFQNMGKVVEATFVPGTNGQMVAVYGVRDKSFRERTIQHLEGNEAIYRNVDRAATLGLRATDTIYNIKGVHELQHLNTTERRQNGILRNIGEVLMDR